MVTQSDQKGLVDFSSLGLEAIKGRVVEVPAMLKEMSMNVMHNGVKVSVTSRDFA